MNPLAAYLSTPGTRHYRVIDVTAKRRPNVSDIIKATAQAHRVRVDDILCASRNRRIVYPRQEIMYRAAVETLLSFPQIGRALGNRDQSTIRHGIVHHAMRNGLPIPRGLQPEGEQG